MTTSSANASGRPNPHSSMQQHAARLVTLSALGLVLGCGGGAEGDDEGGYDAPPFSGAGVSVGGATGAPPSGISGASGALGGNGSVNMELGNGGAVTVLPGTGGTGMGTMPPPPVTMMAACQANSASCQGAAIVSCNAEGTALTTQACGANSACTVVNGAPTCQSTVAPTCTANQAFCDTANVVAQCNAEGTAFTTQRCPNGQNCTGAGVCQPVSCNPQGMLSANGNGGVTVYWFAQGTLDQPRRPDQDVNCGFNASRAANDDGGANDRVAFIQDPALFGALNFTQWGNGAACGACVQINPINGGQPVTITIADSCNPSNNNPTCTSGHIDLSRAAFQRVANAGTGDFNGVTWRFVPCDGVDNVQFRLKEPNNQYWNEFVVMNHRYPIARAQVLMEDGPAPGSSDGRWVDAERGGFGNPNDPNTYYNYWRTTEGGADGGAMGTFRVRITDINGGIIEQQLALGSDVITSDGQFGCQ